MRKRSQEALPIKESDLTPMYRQWAQAKRAYPDVLLLFRMGDFYEMFGEDAEIGARVLGLTLTSRKYAGEKRIAMCGVPYHALDRYLRQLLQQGYRAAICEQIEDPRHAKGLVRRAVTRVVTPGTLTEEELLAPDEHNFLVSVCSQGALVGLAAVDVSTGVFLTTEIALNQKQSHEAKAPQATDASALVAQNMSPPPAALEHATPLQEERLDTAKEAQALPLPVDAPPENPFAPALDEIRRLRPAEIIVAENDPLRPALQALSGIAITALAENETTLVSPEELLCQHFGVESLRGFGLQEHPAAVAAAAQALRYLQATHLQALPQLTGLSYYSPNQFMIIDATTRRNLELVESLRGGKQGTLVQLLDKTKTPMGARLLKDWIVQPLLDKTQIEQRLDAVENLLQEGVLAAALQEHLKGIYDLERLTSRVTAGTANARDLRALSLSLQRLPALKEELAHARADLLLQLREEIGDLQELADLLARALADNPPATLTEGGLIREGFHRELDELREAAAHGREWIAELQDRERARTGIKNLRIGYNQIFGYYIEVTKSFLPYVPPDYERKQTLANAERFITPELKEWESKILGAEERSCELEYELFVQLRATAAQQAPLLQRTARALAQLDVLASLAQAAAEYGYTRPEIVDSDELHIVAGRHPVVERTQRQEAFVPNDAYLNGRSHQLLIITGPNMAGKSTYLRQVALITLMAQMGSFVPAQAARIGLVDRIFTRVGASDDLATGQSTFMMEMTETANILHNATVRSLIVLDEIGRGTSTFDGLSIAWAVAEYIVKHIGAKTLFATHYHHLNELAQILPGVRNLRVLVKEEGDHITFLRKIVEGGTDRSYGIQVARLAGLPPEVITRAKEVLHTIEQEDLAVAPQRRAVREIAPPVQLQLFEAASHPVLEKLKHLSIDTLTPVEALFLLKEWQDELNK